VQGPHRAVCEYARHRYREYSGIRSDAAEVVTSPALDGVQEYAVRFWEAVAEGVGYEIWGDSGGDGGRDWEIFRF